MWKFLSGLFSSGRKPPPSKPAYFVSASSQSQDRIARLGLTTPSERASHILDRGRLAVPAEKETPEPAGYRADPGLHWIIDLGRGEEGQFTRDELWKTFDTGWRTKFGASEIYGRALPDGQWTFPISGGSPEKYDQVQVALQLVERFPEDNVALDIPTFEGFLEELNRRVAKYLPGTTVHAREEIPAALEKGKSLLSLKQEFERDLVIGLRSDSMFPGILAWDALLSVGLKWGDQDLFHWNNLNRQSGPDQFFSVWSDTPPGYFFPEEVKAGKFNPVNLLFGFSIPRSPDPLGVFDCMVDAIVYCQKKLGGKIFSNRGAFDLQEERSQLSELVGKMNEKGLPPGSPLALRIF